MYNVLKEVHPDVGVSSKAMSIMNSFCNDIFERLATEAQRIMRQNNKSIMGVQEMQQAVKKIIPGELCEECDFEGLEACKKYTSSD